MLNLHIHATGHCPNCTCIVRWNAEEADDEEKQRHHPHAGVIDCSATEFELLLSVCVRSI